jgi:hypothetical protein
VSEAEPRFDEAEVLAEARAATGLDDFGDPAFRDGLRVLLETYEKGARFTPRGRRRYRRRVVQLLVDAAAVVGHCGVDACRRG